MYLLTDPARDSEVEDRYQSSPSRLKLWDECPRKWWYQYVLERPGGGSSPAAALGTQVHTLVEDHYTGQIPLPGLGLGGKAERMAKALIPHLPPRGPNVRPEHAFGLVLDRSWFYGLKDIFVSDDLAPEVWDVKTSSDPRRWGRTDYDLPTDYQAIVYAAAALARHPTAPRVRVCFAYVSSKTERYTHTAECVLERDYVLSEIARLDELVAMQHEHGTDDPPEGNPDACRMWGGCPMLDVCPVPGERDLLALLTKGNTVKKPALTPDAVIEDPTDYMIAALDAARTRKDWALVSQIAMLLAQRGAK